MQLLASFLDIFQGRLNIIYSRYLFWRYSQRLRNEAIVIRKKIILERGFSLVDNEIKRQIRKYCKSVFGSKKYCPWIFVYTELKGKFIEGWIPYEYYRLKIIPYLNPREVSYISELKTFDHRIHSFFSVEPLLILINRMVFDSSFNLLNVEQASEKMKAIDCEIVIKKDDSGYGRHVRFCHSGEVNLNDLLLEGDYVVQPSVKQHHVMNGYSSKSVNTIRITTYINSQSEICVVGKYLRLGIGESRVDNTYAGGVFLFLDEDGTPTSSAYTRHGFEAGTKHPTSGIPYKEMFVPSMREAINLCINAHLKYPYVGIIGWDVYIDENENPRLLEWNATMIGFWLSEALDGPLFDIEDVKIRLKEKMILTGCNMRKQTS